MIRMTSTIKRGLIVSALVLSASACSSNDNGSGSTSNVTTPAPPVVVAPTRQEDQFGVAFGTAFRGASDGEPFQVQDGDIVAVSLTTEPVTIN